METEICRYLYEDFCWSLWLLEEESLHYKQENNAGEKQDRDDLIQQLEPPSKTLEDSDIISWFLSFHVFKFLEPNKQHMTIIEPNPSDPPPKFVIFWKKPFLI